MQSDCTLTAQLFSTSFAAHQCICCIVPLHLYVRDVLTCRLIPLTFLTQGVSVRSLRAQSHQGLERLSGCLVHKHRPPRRGVQSHKRQRWRCACSGRPCHPYQHRSQAQLVQPKLTNDHYSIVMQPVGLRGADAMPKIEAQLAQAVHGCLHDLEALHKVTSWVCVCATCPSVCHSHQLRGP